jgi:pimeloyl-ACP methyl ester carboxylesterase
LQKLANQDFKVLASDIRGHGFSTRERTSLVASWDIFIKDLELLVKSISKPPVIGIGHSIGGYFTYAAAALYPGLFSKLILLDPIIYPSKTLWSSAIIRTLGLSGYHWLPKTTRSKKSEFDSKQDALDHYLGKGMFKSWNHEFVEAFVDTAIEQDTAVSYELCCNPEFEAQIYETLPLNTWSHLSNIDIPVMVVRGENSHMFHRSSGQKLNKKIKNSKFIELDSLGHFLTMEDPDRIIETILPFLR